MSEDKSIQMLLIIQMDNILSTLNLLSRRSTWLISVQRCKNSIYIAEGTRLLQSPSKIQLVDRDAFIPEVLPGKPANTSLNPIL